MHMYVYMHVCTLHIVLCTCASPCTPSYILYGHAAHAVSLLAVKEAKLHFFKELRRSGLPLPLLLHVISDYRWIQKEDSERHDRSIDKIFFMLPLTCKAQLCLLVTSNSRSHRKLLGNKTAKSGGIFSKASLHQLLTGYGISRGKTLKKQHLLIYTQIKFL